MDHHWRPSPSARPQVGQGSESVSQTSQASQSPQAPGQPHARPTSASTSSASTSTTSTTNIPSSSIPHTSTSSEYVLSSAPTRSSSTGRARSYKAGSSAGSQSSTSSGSRSSRTPTVAHERGRRVSADGRTSRLGGPSSRLGLPQRQQTRRTDFTGNATVERYSSRDRAPRNINRANISSTSNTGNTGSGPTLRRQVNMNAELRAIDRSRTSGRMYMGGLTVQSPSTAGSSRTGTSRTSTSQTLSRDAHAARRKVPRRGLASGGLTSSSPSMPSQGYNSKASMSSLEMMKVLSQAFHQSSRARCDLNMFEKLPTEILCTILGYVVDPGEDKLSMSDDGDGPKTGNSLFFWYLDHNRSLLRLVCRTWNETILAMAREVNVQLTSDESMEALLRIVSTKERTTVAFDPQRPQRIHPASVNNNSSHTSASSNAQQGPTMAVRRSARLQGTSTATPPNPPSNTRPSRSLHSEWEWGSFNPAAVQENSRVGINMSTVSDIAESHGIQHHRYPWLVQHIMQQQCERRRIVKQTFIPIQGFFNPPPKRLQSSSATSSEISETRTNPWACPPFISTIAVKGNLPQLSDPKEEVILSAGYSGTHPRPGGGAVDGSSSKSQYHMSNGVQGSMLDHWLRSAVPKRLKAFSISRSADFGLNSLLSLPESLTKLSITRCPKITGGILSMGFRRLSNLTSLTVCSDIMFTDESFVVALHSLAHLCRLVYIYPCDPIQPAWRDLFRYCSSCELYHRRITTKTFIRQLLMPELPPHIKDFSFEMDEPKFQHVRVDSLDQTQHGFDSAENTKFSLSLWSANSDDKVAACSSIAFTKVEVGWCGFDLSSTPLRSWWPDSLTRLDLSKSVVTGSRFDVPPQLQELVLSYPLEPNEISAGGSSDVPTEAGYFPESLTRLEAYVDKMLLAVPHQLEHFTINCFQVPAVDSLAAMQDRVQHTLKSWTVRLLCPQRPRQSGFSSLQLYAPIVYVDESSDEEEWMNNDSSEEYEGLYSEDSDDTSVDSQPEGEDHVLGQLDAYHHRRVHRGRAALQQAAESVTAEQYDVTPIRLREATKGMKVLEKLEVEVNYQHYRFCKAIWKGGMGLSEPINPIGKRGAYAKRQEGHDHEGMDVNNETMDMAASKGEGARIAAEDGHVRKKQRLAATALTNANEAMQDRRGKGKAVERERGLDRVAVDTKGKGKKVDYNEEMALSSSTLSKSVQAGSKRPWRDMSEDDLTISTKAELRRSELMGHARAGGRPKTEIRYWNNSCCGKRCLGWIRMHHT
ncbi:hypothetical protein BGZ98_007984 [Dissophora globulifera]|nr:hypothetical protein BGZ98_007984 [Dissophora globulifera]